MLKIWIFTREHFSRTIVYQISRPVVPVPNKRTAGLYIFPTVWVLSLMKSPAKWFTLALCECCSTLCLDRINHHWIFSVSFSTILMWWTWYISPICQEWNSTTMTYFLNLLAFILAGMGTQWLAQPMWSRNQKVISRCRWKAKHNSCNTYIGGWEKDMSAYFIISQFLNICKSLNTCQ